MRVLHVVKTSDGGRWAALQARELVKLGVEVHVALPSPTGGTVRLWKEAGCQVHHADLGLPITKPWELVQRRRTARLLIQRVQPDLIHSHFVTTTLGLRLFLGKDHGIPRVFQVAGPLHLEHVATRFADIRSAGRRDYWIASSRCIQCSYVASGVAESRLFLSYYGGEVGSIEPRPCEFLRRALGLTRDQWVVGNISYMYRPRWELGRMRGIKNHETLLRALGIVLRERRDTVAVVIGGAAGGARWYENSLRRTAARVGNGRLLMPGAWPHEMVRKAWGGFDCALHIPLSENLGGVGEPMMAGVPVVASSTGGLPELVLPEITGRLVGMDDERAAAEAVLETLDNYKASLEMAERGRELVNILGDVRRTASEVFAIYQHLLKPGTPRPPEFDSIGFARQKGWIKVVQGEPAWTTAPAPGLAQSAIGASGHDKKSCQKNS